jgi:hypothetical protein
MVVPHSTSVAQAFVHIPLGSCKSQCRPSVMSQSASDLHPPPIFRGAVPPSTVPVEPPVPAALPPAPVEPVVPPVPALLVPLLSSPPAPPVEPPAPLLTELPPVLLLTELPPVLLVELLAGPLALDEVPLLGPVELEPLPVVAAVVPCVAPDEEPDEEPEVAAVDLVGSGVLSEQATTVASAQAPAKQNDTKRIVVSSSGQ